MIKKTLLLLTLSAASLFAAENQLPGAENKVATASSKASPVHNNYPERFQIHTDNSFKQAIQKPVVKLSLYWIIDDTKTEATEIAIKGPWTVLDVCASITITKDAILDQIFSSTLDSKLSGALKKAFREKNSLPSFDLPRVMSIKFTGDYSDKEFTATYDHKGEGNIPENLLIFQTSGIIQFKPYDLSRN